MITWLERMLRKQQKLEAHWSSCSKLIAHELRLHDDGAKMPKFPTSFRGVDVEQDNDAVPAVFQEDGSLETFLQFLKKVPDSAVFRQGDLP